nr:MAG TPA: hypothetical protein [Caudoviricetes sp.]
MFAQVWPLLRCLAQINVQRFPAMRTHKAHALPLLLRVCCNLFRAGEKLPHRNIKHGRPLLECGVGWRFYLLIQADWRDTEQGGKLLLCYIAFFKYLLYPIHRV